MAEIEHQGLDIGGDDRFVLDDQDFGGEFRLDVALRPGDQGAHAFGVVVQDLGGLVDGEAFQRGQQEGLAVPRRNAHARAG